MISLKTTSVVSCVTRFLLRPRQFSAHLGGGPTKGLLCPDGLSRILRSSFQNSQFNCHINTEVSAGTRSVYYLQKYFAKVHDTVCAKVDFQPGSTRAAQMTQFFRMRYLCIGEAYWQLYGYPFVYFSPMVTSVYVICQSEEQCARTTRTLRPWRRKRG